MVLKKLVELPSQLHVFKMHSMLLEGWGWASELDPAYRWNHALLKDALEPQQHNLKILDIGLFGDIKNQNMFDVSDFPYLHTLALCVKHEQPDTQACKNWLTASLKTLVLDLHFQMDYMAGPYSYIGSEETKIVLDFARLAQERKEAMGDGVGLTHIGIRVFSTGMHSWTEGDCPLCYGNFEVKKELLQCLRDVRNCGFEIFWEGTAGAKLSIEMIETGCKCAPDLWYPDTFVIDETDYPEEESDEEDDGFLFA